MSLPIYRIEIPIKQHLKILRSWRLTFRTTIKFHEINFAEARLEASNAFKEHDTENLKIVG